MKLKTVVIAIAVELLAFSAGKDCFAVDPTLPQSQSVQQAEQLAECAPGDASCIAAVYTGSAAPGLSNPTQNGTGGAAGSGGGSSTSGPQDEMKNIQQNASPSGSNPNAAPPNPGGGSSIGSLPDKTVPSSSGSKFHISDGMLAGGLGGLFVATCAFLLFPGIGVPGAFLVFAIAGIALGAAYDKENPPKDS